VGADRPMPVRQPQDAKRQCHFHSTVIRRPSDGNVRKGD
jgi:hypothetical protein